MGELVKAQLEHTDVVLLAHDSEVCAGEFCTLHNRSDHPMRGFPQQWRWDVALMERVCPHGVGHPDPDDIALTRSDGWAARVHGCDGCCIGVKYPTNPYQSDTDSHGSRSTGDTVDPLCLALKWPASWAPEMCICDVLKQARAEERERIAAASGEEA